MGAGAGVEGMEGVHGGAVGVLGSGMLDWVFAETGREEESEADLSMTGVGGGALTAGLTDD